MALTHSGGRLVTLAVQKRWVWCDSRVRIPVRCAGDRMKRFVEGQDRGQSTLLPECLEDWIDQNNPVRVIDVLSTGSIWLILGSLELIRRRRAGLHIIHWCCRSFTSTAISIVYSRADDLSVRRDATLR